MIIATLNTDRTRVVACSCCGRTIRMSCCLVAHNQSNPGTHERTHWERVCVTCCLHVHNDGYSVDETFACWQFRNMNECFEWPLISENTHISEIMHKYKFGKHGTCCTLIHIWINNNDRSSLSTLYTYAIMQMSVWILDILLISLEYW